MGRVASIATRPFSAMCQAWNDYKLGRRLRKGLETKEAKQREPRCEICSTGD
jgi:hypothetical protein